MQLELSAWVEGEPHAGGNQDSPSRANHFCCKLFTPASQVISSASGSAHREQRGERKPGRHHSRNKQQGMLDRKLLIVLTLRVISAVVVC